MSFVLKKLFFGILIQSIFFFKKDIDQTYFQYTCFRSASNLCAPKSELREIRK